MATISTTVNLTGVTGIVYAAAGYTSVYNNVPQSNTINLYVPYGANVQLTNPNYTTDTTTGFHVLQTITAQGASTDYTVWSYYGQVTLTSKTNGQKIVFQLTRPQGGANNSGVNVVFSDGEIAYTSNTSATGVWTMWITQGGSGTTGTTGWGTNSVASPFTAATALDQAVLGAGGSATLNTSINSSSVTTWSATPTTFTLTTNVDAPGTGAFTASSPSGNSTVYGQIGGTTATFTPGDTITATGTGNTFNLTDSVGGSTLPTGSSVSGVQTLNLNSAAATGVVSFAGYTGLTTLNVVDVTGSAGITAAATTNTTVTSTAQAVGNVIVNGGLNVTVTDAGATTGTVTIGGTTAAAGTVTVNQTYSAAASITGGIIAVTGGTTVTVNEVAATNTSNAIAVVEGAVNVDGTALTTTVSVTQTGGVTAQAASANVANTSSTGYAATSGVTTGAVAIRDATDIAGTSATTSGTIRTVTLSNYGASTISSNVLTSLNLSSSTASGALASGTLGVTYGLTTGNPTSLALGLGGGSLGALTLNGNLVTTINAALTANTTLDQIVDTGLRTLALSGTGVLALTTSNTALTSVTASGAAGLNADVSGAAGLTSINFSGTSASNTLTLNSTVQAYTGGSGNDVITISANATKAITGGSGTDRIVLNASGATFTATTGTNVTGFESFGLGSAATGTYNLSTLGQSGVSSIFVGLLNGASVITNIATGTVLNITDAPTQALTYRLASTSGPTSAVTVNLVGSTVAATSGGGTRGYITTALTLEDANLVGIGSVTINSDASVYQGLQTITTLTDTALSTLAITGTGSLSIGAEATSQTAITISDNGTGTSATADGIVGLTSTGNVLGYINYSGTHAFTIGTLTDLVPNLSVTNANTGTTGVLTIGTHTDANLVSLTLNGAVALTGTYTTTSAATVSGATDNSAVSLTMTGATGAKTVTLGNGNDTVVIGNVGTTASTDTVTLGTGQDSVTFAGANNNVVINNVTVAAHTGADQFSYGLTGANFATVAGGTITGAQTNDILKFSAETIATNVLDAVTAGSTAALTITAVESAAAAAAGDVAYSYFGGNTYVAENNAGVAAAAANTTLVILTGQHTFVTGTAQVTLLS